MMEIKIECGCGTRYKFDVEPVEGRMPNPVRCPSCGVDGTAAANEGILQNLLLAAQNMAASMPARTPAVAAAPAIPAAVPIAAAPPIAAVAAPPAGLRVSGSVAVAATPPPMAAPAPAVAGGGLLSYTTFFIKERAGLLALTDTYDIFDPASGYQIGIAKEELPIWSTLLRLVVEKSRLPTAVNIYEQEGQPPVVSIRRGFTFLRQKIRVVAGNQQLGYFKSKLISIGGGFYVYDNQDQQVAEVKGNWKGWDFQFINNNGRQIGTVTKKWAGFGKELFTSADNYMISLSDLNGASPAASALLLAAGLAIDIVYKEDE